MTSWTHLLRGGLVGLSVSCVAACAPPTPNDGNTNNDGSGGAGAAVAEIGTRIQFAGAAHVAFPDITRVAPLPDGGVVVVNLDYNGRILVAMLDSELVVHHTASFAAASVGDVVVQGETVYVMGAGPDDIVRIARFALDGTLRDIRDLDGVGPAPPNAPGGRLVVDGDTLVLLQGVQVVRLDAALRPLWGRTIAASAMTIVDDDYVFAGTPLRLAPANSSGIEVVRTSRDGDVRWQQFATPGPGQHTLAGVTVVDGDIVAVCGNEAADTRSTASLHPVFATRFAADTGAVRGTRAYVLEATVDGDPVPLSFGSGLLTRTDADGALLFGAVANSGVLGLDVRTQLVVRDDGNVVTARNIGGAFAVARTGAYVGATSTPDGIAIVRVGQLDDDDGCGALIAGEGTSIVTVDIANAGGIDLLPDLSAAQVNDAEATPATPETTTTTWCGG